MKIYLSNCITEPFGNALKALGVIRLIGEQKDPDMKSYWKNGELVIETKAFLSQQEIIEFFMKEYSPTPILAPWLNQSGFWAGFETPGMKAVMATEEKRFEPYRNNVEKIRSIIKNIAEEQGIKLSDLKDKKKSKEFKDKNKEKLIIMCRNQLDDIYVNWSDAAVVINSEGYPKYPPINGSGGNDARLEFTHTFIEMVASVLLKLDDESKYRISSELLSNSLFGTFTNNLKKDVSVGKFMPGLTGGLNQGEGIENGSTLVNPWDIILFMEGTIMWASGIGRKNESSGSLPISPFTVKLSSPYSSADPSDPKSFELWLPVWKNPAYLNEIRMIFIEGRSDVGRKTASNGLQFAESVNSLGVDRGINEFVRYSLSVKNGQASFLIPLGQYEVKMNRYQELILELDPLLSEIDSFLGKKKENLPPSFKKAKDEIEKAIFDFTVHGGNYNAKSVLISLGRFEKLLSDHKAMVSNSSLLPLGGLSPEWLKAMNDNSIEMRIALAISSITSRNYHNEAWKKIGEIRSNIESVEKSGKFKWSKQDGEFSWLGNSIYEKMVNTLFRRMINAEKYNLESLPLYSPIKLSAYEISEFIHGRFNASLTEDLIFGLLLIDRSGNDFYNYAHSVMGNRETPQIIPYDFSLLKMIFLPEDLKIRNEESVHIVPEAEIIPLLKAGRVEDACKIAKNRLLSSNLKPINTIFPNFGPNYGLRLAAALLLPVNQTELMDTVLMTRRRDIKNE